MMTHLKGSSRSTSDSKMTGLYDLQETLGKGHFAVVKLARHIFTDEKVAVKVIDKTKLDEISRAHLLQEVTCMKLVQHPNVVRLYEVIDTQTKLYLILELGDGGDMYDYIMQHENGLGEDFARIYFIQIVQAVSYCHKLHVVHRDLKPENVIFFKDQGVVKLTDFGFSNCYNPGQKLETSCGSLAYSAPEILLGDSYDAPAVDVWSLGVLLYMLVCGEPPFNETNDSETLTMIMDCKYRFPDHISDSCRSLISQLLVREPEKRLDLKTIENHPWLKMNQVPIAVEPLITKQDISVGLHSAIIESMICGNVADEFTITNSLESDSYDHITATYFLLAERKLKKNLSKKKAASSPACQKSRLNGEDQGKISSQPRAIEDRQKPPLERQKSTESLPHEDSALGSSPRRHLPEREHLSIQPRHNWSIVKEGIESLEEEEEEHHLLFEDMDLTGTPSGSKAASRKQTNTSNRTTFQQRRTTPTTLNQITEEEGESEDEYGDLKDEKLSNSRSIHGRQTITVKNKAPQFKRAKVKKNNSSRGGYSSSDASDEDSDTRRRSDKFDIPSRGKRRGSKDGPPGGGSGSGSNNSKQGMSGPGGKANNSGTRGGYKNDSNSSNNSNSASGNYEQKRNNELRDSLKQSNLSVNSSHSSSSYSISKYAIDPNNTTPSDSDDQATELHKVWSKNSMTKSDSNLYIIPSESEKNNSLTDSEIEKNSRDTTLYIDKLNIDLNGNGNQWKLDFKKKRNRIRNFDDVDDEGPVPNKTPSRVESNCCRLF
ncbi:SNF-related serine/threonine-protein kinase-like [Anneissia japonica]|uniref:SNF-related serine/threonine-protein kinase-like n=1 Tax=Anneissia japonica TaxID=1529436 RepID=UPI001425AA72|nr:SNF-related serine/threonine-protein kinase-like [Anneissia japonica]